jgi:sterol desaturase/sphingolipid hydroxylase (fatty acid hydroxylase superfamily)
LITSKRFFIIQAVAVLFIALFFEKLTPRNKDLSSFVEWRKNLFWLAANLVAWPYLVSRLSLLPQKVLPFSLLSEPMPFAVQLIAGLLLMDLVSYIVHSLFHRLPFLWEIHKVHHSITQLTAFSSFRHSWFEAPVHMLSSLLVANTLSLSFEVVFILNTCFRFFCVIQHSNVRLQIPGLDYLIVTPANHALHHSQQMFHPHGQNFSFIFSFWDRFFGTYAEPSRCKPGDLGLNPDRGLSDSLWFQFFYPVSGFLVKKKE